MAENVTRYSMLDDGVSTLAHVNGAGEWVTYEDYERIVRQLTEEREALKSELGLSVQLVERLNAEMERLSAAKDEVRQLREALTDMLALIDMLWEAVPWGKTFNLDVKLLNEAPIRARETLAPSAAPSGALDWLAGSPPCDHDWVVHMIQMPQGYQKPGVTRCAKCGAYKPSAQQSASTAPVPTNYCQDGHTWVTKWDRHENVGRRCAVCGKVELTPSPASKEGAERNDEK